ncbi:MAG: CopG family transcriptional regulator [Pseudomonadota bacterium]|nr:CopG family transcriptional regulator [Pseudomonadota bacterium]
MKAEDFDHKFDEGKSVLKQLDLAKSRRPKQEQKRVNVDFPLWMIQSLDKEARRLGVPRQSIIKLWLADRLQQTSQLTQPNASAARK